MSELETENGDLKFTNGSLTLITGGAEIRQRLEQSLRFLLGEWFLDVTKGIPYLQKILGTKNPVREEIQAFIIAAIVATPGVTRVIEFDLNITTQRRLNISFRALGDEGVLEMEITI